MSTQKKSSTSILSITTITLMALLAGCKSSGDKTETKKNYAEDQLIGYSFETESENNVTNVVLSQLNIKDGFTIKKDTSLNNQKINSYSVTRTSLTDKAKYTHTMARDDNGITQISDFIVTKYNDTMIELTNKYDSDYKQTITFANIDISGKPIFRVINFDNDATVGKLAQISTAQNTFGNQQTCRAPVSRVSTKDSIELLASPIAENQTKAQFAAFVNQQIQGTKLSDTWQGIDWVVGKNDSEGYAYYKNAIWRMDYFDKDEEKNLTEKEKSTCFFVNKSQADFIATAVKTAYGVK